MDGCLPWFVVHILQPSSKSTEGLFITTNAGAYTSGVLLGVAELSTYATVSRQYRCYLLREHPENYGNGSCLKKVSTSTNELRKACLPWVKSARTHSGGFWKALSLTASPSHLAALPHTCPPTAILLTP